LRRFSAACSVLVCLVAVGLSSCGDSTHKTPTPAKIQLNPTSASLAFGGVQTISATVLDQNDAAIASATVTFSSNNPAVSLTNAAVSQGTWFTTACAGTWNSSQIVCQPGNTPQTVQITATSGSVSATTTLYIHAKVDRVVVTPELVNCESQGHTHPFRATVYSGGQDITATVGAINWGVISGQDVVSVDSSGLATAGQPGRSSVFASASGVTSQPSTFITCPVQSIRVHVQDSADTSFSLGSGATQQLSADVVDTNGNTIKPNLNWVSSQPSAASVAAGTVTGIAGFTSITATCLPPACNRGLNPAYGNAVTARATGTLNSTVYAASTSSTSLVPIDVSTNTPGTAITLPATPNSMVISPQGDFLYLGSAQGLMTVNLSANTVTNNSGFPGKVLAASLDGRVLVASADQIALISSSSTEVRDIAGATAAAFSIDNRAYIVAGNKLYIHTPGELPTGASEVLPPSLTLSGSGTATAFLATGALGFVSQNDRITAVANCNRTVLQDVSTSEAAQLIQPLPDGAGVVAVSPTGISQVAVNPAPPEPLAGCPPSANLSLTSKAFSSTLNVRQLILLPDGSKAYLTSETGPLQVYDISANSLSTIALANGATALTGGALLDASKVYVGASDSAVHLIDVAAGKDAQQIPVGLVPDLVVVK
jgi:hypothetical protein